MTKVQDVNEVLNGQVPSYGELTESRMSSVPDRLLPDGSLNHPLVFKQNDELPIEGSSNNKLPIQGDFN